MAVIAKQRYKLDIAPSGGWVIVYVSQHDDEAREIEFEITNQGNAFSIPASINISVQGVKENKGYFSHSCSYSGNIVTMVLADDMTDVTGKAICVLKFTNQSNQKLATAKFILNVDTDSSSEGIIIDTEAEEIFNQMLNEIRAQAASVSADIAELQSMVGSPLVASTVSAMTDHNKIYVYTGSQSGYTNGNWYYWNGSAWTSGGVYNSVAFETDKTLSVENMPADAEVTGDLVYYSTGCRLIEITRKGYYIDVSAQTADITRFIYNPNFNCSVVSCTQNDVFTINALGGSAPQAWAFLDSNGMVIKKTAYADVINYVVVAPENAAWLVINDKGGRKSLYGESAIVAVDDAHKIPTSEVAIIPAPLFPHYPNIDSINKKVTVYLSTIIIDKRVSNGSYYTLMEDTEIDYSSISSTAIGIYFDTVNNVFVAGAYSVARDGGRYLLFMLIRVNPVSVYNVTVSAGFPVVIDGMIDGVVYSDNKNIRSINHRGLEQIAPENTLIAFKYSKTAGFDGVETDVRFTSDGVPVLLHDATINRTARNTDGTTISEPINIADITYNEALNYDFGVFKNARFTGTKIPTFEQFIRTCRNLGLHSYIELKVGTEQQIQNLNSIVIRNGMQGKVSWISYSITFLAYIHTVDPKARIGVIVSDLNQTENFIAQVLALKSDNEVFFDLDNFNAITSEGVERIISLGLPLELYTGTIANIVNADPYITGFTLGAFNAGKALISNWSSV